MNYESHLVKNDEKGAKYSNNPNGHESTRISETNMSSKKDPKKGISISLSMGEV